MIDASLKSFLQTGRLGPVSLGMSESEIRAVLGNPDDFAGTTNKHGRFLILKYGDLEFHFNNERLCLIHTDDFEVPSGGRSIQLDPWLITNELTSTVASFELRNNGLKVESLESALGKCLLCGVGVQLIFDDEDYLCALSYSDPNC